MLGSLVGTEVGEAYGVGGLGLVGSGHGGGGTGEGTIGPVSYTHLDVYKRQTRPCGKGC